MSSSSSMKSPVPLTLIVAATPSNAIGRGSALPWRLPKEMAYFAKVTKGAPSANVPEEMNAVIMGRKTWEGIPNKFRPLPGRINVVVSRQEDYSLGTPAPASTHLASSLSSSLALLSSLPTPPSRIFLIGGAQLYSHALSAPFPPPTSSTPAYLVNRVLLTRLALDYDDCDAFFPALEGGGEGSEGWKKSGFEELKEWTGVEIEEVDGKGKEKDRVGGKEVEYEFEMWTR